jgi:hypothetical protein
LAKNKQNPRRERQAQRRELELKSKRRTRNITLMIGMTLVMIVVGHVAHRRYAAEQEQLRLDAAPIVTWARPYFPQAPTPETRLWTQQLRKIIETRFEDDLRPQALRAIDTGELKLLFNSVSDMGGTMDASFELMKDDSSELPVISIDPKRVLSGKDENVAVQVLGHEFWHYEQYRSGRYPVWVFRIMKPNGNVTRPELRTRMFLELEAYQRQYSRCIREGWPGVHPVIQAEIDLLKKGDLLGMSHAVVMRESRNRIDMNKWGSYLKKVAKEFADKNGKVGRLSRSFFYVAPSHLTESVKNV